MHDESKLEEQVLELAAEQQLSSQVDAVEKIDVDIDTDLLKIVQGKADSVSVEGQGLVIQKDIRVQHIELRTDSVDINPLKAIFGEIELERPTDATARIVLTEPDINRAFNSDYVRRQTKNIELNVDGQIVTLEMQQMELFLPGDGKMVFNGKVMLHEAGKTRQDAFTAVARPRTKDQPVLLESFTCTQGEGFPLEVIVAFMEKLKELVNLPFFAIEGMALRVKEMQVQKGSLTLLAEAHVRQLPSS